MDKKRLVVFASGSKEGGGSGFSKLVHSVREGIIDAEIVAVVSNISYGGVQRRATHLGIPFIHMPGPWTAEQYQAIAEQTQGDFFALSGWIKLVKGLDLKTRFNSRTVFNIHPGPLPEFGGPGMHGHHVHEAVITAYNGGLGSRHYTEVCMHFVTDEYDRGPVFFRLHIRIKENETADALASRVNVEEHRIQPRITNLVVTGQITWDGITPNTLELPTDYHIDEYHLDNSVVIG